MGSPLDALKDPTMSIPMLLDGMQGLYSLVDMIHQRNNPNTRLVQNIGIGSGNNLLNSARSGQGMENPFSRLSQYTGSQIANGGHTIDPFLGSLGSIGSGKPGQFKMPESPGFGDLSMYSTPYRTQLEQSAQNGNLPTENFQPQGRGFIGQVQDFIHGLPHLAVGTSSIPQEGPYYLHQGEAVIPAQQNPAAMPPGVPGPAMTPNAGIQQAGAPAALPPAPQMPPPQGATSLNMQPNTNLPQAGLNPQAIAQMQQRQHEQNAAQLAQQQRMIQEQAAQQGNAFGGNAKNEMFQARMGASQQDANSLRDLQIAGEDRRFGDQMATANFGLNQQLGLGGLEQGNQQLALQRELGLGNLGIAQQQANTAQQGMQGQLGLGQGQLALQGDLGRGQLALGQGQLGLQTELGRGNLGLGQQQQNLAQTLGLGNLNLGNRQQSLAETMGQGQLGLGQRSQTLQEQLGYGNLGLGERQQSLAENLGGRQQTLAEQMGQGNLALGQQEQQFQHGTAFNEGQRQFNVQSDLARQLGLGNLGVQQGQLDLGRLGQQTQTEFGQYDRGYQAYQDQQNRLDALAGVNTQANQGQEQSIQDIINRILGSGSLPQPAGA